MKVGGEKITLSFGPNANAITSHLCNLEGLACTSSSYIDASSKDDDTIPLCDPYITHMIHKETYVPRVLFVDGRNCFSSWNLSSDENNSNINTTSNASTNFSNPSTIVSSQYWNGGVQLLSTNEIHEIVNQDNYSSSTSSTFNNLESSSNNHRYSLFNSSLRDIHNNASILSSFTPNNSQSRYHSSKYKSISTQHQYSSISSHNSNERHMNWDDLDEENSDNDDDNYYHESEQEKQDRKIRMEYQNYQNFHQQEIELQNNLNHSWDNLFFPSKLQDMSSTSVNKDMGHNSKDPQLEESHNQTCNDDHEDDKTDPTKSQRITVDMLEWIHFFMPPHPPENFYAAPLPFERLISSSSFFSESQNSFDSLTFQNFSILSSHQYGYGATSSNCSDSQYDSSILSHWRDEIYWNELRKYIESCDSVRTFQIMTDSDFYFFTGLANNVLEELGDECKSAGKFSLMVHNYSGDFTRGGMASGTSSYNNETSYWRSERKVVSTFRSHLNQGLSLHGISTNSDLTLPLSLSNCYDAFRETSVQQHNSQSSLFEASAAAALALESMTLPYRLSASAYSMDQSKQRRSKIGIQSGYFQGSGQGDDYDAYPSVDKLSFHEFVSSLRPSNRHVMLELSGLIRSLKVQSTFPSNSAYSKFFTQQTNSELYQRLLQGTSIERRQLEAERARDRSSFYRRSRAQDIDPGLWMDQGNSGGSLTSLSPISIDGNDASKMNRSMHKHFSLLSSLRPSSHDRSCITSDPVSVYTTLMMEGMGIRYRPETSIATVVNQSLDDLTGNQSYGAGSYWNSLYKRNSSNGSVGVKDVSILAVLGNTTRIHPYLNSSAMNLKQALGKKYSGYMSRDVMAGMVPEREDCSEALEHCMNLRDVYDPPYGTYDDDDEGDYFDDNED